MHHKWSAFLHKKLSLGPLRLNHGIYIYQQPGPGLIFEVQNTIGILEVGPIIPYRRPLASKASQEKKIIDTIVFGQFLNLYECVQTLESNIQKNNTFCPKSFAWAQHSSTSYPEFLKPKTS